MGGTTKGYPGSRDSLCAANITFDEASAILAAHCDPLGQEDVALAEAGGRVLAKDVLSRIDSPRCDVAAMDGFAIRTADLSGQQSLPIVGAGFPGSLPAMHRPGTACRVTTGGTIPKGADRVIPWELATAQDDHVRFDPDLPRKSHIRAKCSDLQSGATILSSGQSLTSLALVAVAGGDVDEVTVWRKPRIAMFATGDELVEPGKGRETLARIPDSLSAAMRFMIVNWGGVVTSASRAMDRLGDIRSAAEAALSDADVLVFTAGASHGERDLTIAAMQDLGLNLRFAGVRMKPGKPVWYGTIAGKQVLGLPGNPTAAMTVARLFLAPLLVSLQGRQWTSALDWEDRATLEPIPANGDREAFLCADEAKGTVRLLDRQSSSDQARLVLANALVRIPPFAKTCPAGSSVQTLSFQP
ncbi:molybdopterin molybdotransferase MoeA [Sphingopyxis terrae]|uniref:molybdopterin molybdotransferase MoeA n=1 Tax=Sphingopyxis terrae TaxID=33052 RepID=UPI002A0F90B0|nr:molybdopterin molybdotransferase MoeA [Sphingopyxis terrae]MDX8356393.1 molybdopterin molybdotransferase MoeA [Sphingopyxis terrae]